MLLATENRIVQVKLMVFEIKLYINVYICERQDSF